MLALQRSIGNRALVQRLAWNTVNGNLAVPVDYASQRIPWDGTYMLDREATEADETFSDLAGKDKPFQKAVQAGLELEWLGEVKAVTKTASDKAAEAFVSKAMKDSAVPGDSAVYSKMVHDAAAAIVSHNQVLTVTPGEPLADIAAIRGASRLVRQPRDFLPEAPDLPGVGVDLATKIPSGGDKKYWEYACVLIALYKAEGIAKVREVTGKPKVPDEARKAVQALHDYYVGEGVQSDDGAARNPVMKQWGYGWSLPAGVLGGPPGPGRIAPRHVHL